MYVSYINLENNDTFVRKKKKKRFLLKILKKKKKKKIIFKILKNLFKFKKKKKLKQKHNPFYLFYFLKLLTLFQFLFTS